MGEREKRAHFPQFQTKIQKWGGNNQLPLKKREGVEQGRRKREKEKVNKPEHSSGKSNRILKVLEGGRVGGGGVEAVGYRGEAGGGRGGKEGGGGKR